MCFPFYPTVFKATFRCKSKQWFLFAITIILLLLFCNKIVALTVSIFIFIHPPYLCLSKYYTRVRCMLYVSEIKVFIFSVWTPRSNLTLFSSTFLFKILGTLRTVDWRNRHLCEWQWNLGLLQYTCTLPLAVVLVAFGHRSHGAFY